MVKRIVSILLVLLLLGIVIFFFLLNGAKKYYPMKYENFIEDATIENDLPEGLLYAIIHTESRFEPKAVSPIGARGLMQITEETFDWIKYRMGDNDTTYADLFDPAVNIQYGGWLVRLLLDEFGTVENMLCAYHAGYGSAKAWLKDAEISPDGVHITNIPYRDTNHYLHKVLTAWSRYTHLYDF